MDVSDKVSSARPPHGISTYLNSLYVDDGTVEVIPDVDAVLSGFILLTHLDSAQSAPHQHQATGRLIERIGKTGWCVELGTNFQAKTLLIASRKDVEASVRKREIMIWPGPLEPLDSILPLRKGEEYTSKWTIVETDYRRRNFGSLDDLNLVVLPA